MNGVWLFPALCSNRTRDNGHKLEHSKFYGDTKQNFFNLRVTEGWNRLPRKAMESLEVFKTCLDAFLGTCFRREIGQDDLQRSFLSPTVL